MSHHRFVILPGCCSASRSATPLLSRCFRRLSWFCLTAARFLTDVRVLWAARALKAFQKALSPKSKIVRLRKQIVRLRVRLRKKNRTTTRTTTHGLTARQPLEPKKPDWSSQTGVRYTPEGSLGHSVHHTFRARSWFSDWRQVFDDKMVLVLYSLQNMSITMIRSTKSSPIIFGFLSYKCVVVVVCYQFFFPESLSTLHSLRRSFASNPSPVAGVCEWHVAWHVLLDETGR